MLLAPVVRTVNQYQAEKYQETQWHYPLDISPRYPPFSQPGPVLQSVQVYCVMTWILERASSIFSLVL